MTPSRASRAELIDYANELFDGSHLTEADRVSSLETVRRKVLEDHDLQVEAYANGPSDFAYSPNVRVVVEDAVWAGDVGHQEAMKHLRELPPGTIVRALLRTGLQDELREAAG